MTAVFLQVRLDSSRLPRKALLELAGVTVLEHAMQALDLVRADRRVLLTTKDSAAEIKPIAESAGWNVFIGSKDDVLDRFVMAAREFNADRIIRATGDNPLVSAEMANAAQDLADRTGAAYAGFSELPVGSGVEVIRTAALEEAWSEARDPYEREHVAPFLYRRPERYHIVVNPAPEGFRSPGTRITLDTPDDYEFLTQLFDRFYQGQPISLKRVVPYLQDRRANAG